MEIYTKPEELEEVRKSLEAAEVSIASAEQSLIPKTTLKLEQKEALQTLRLLDKLEDLDEVQQVSSNVDFDDEVLSEYNSRSSK